MFMTSAFFAGRMFFGGEGGGRVGQKWLLTVASMAIGIRFPESLIRDKQKIIVPPVSWSL